MRLNRKFVLLLLATLPASTAFGQAPRVLDDFDNAAAWEVAASDQVTGQLRTVDADGGKALCLDYDFHGVSGYVGIRRKLALDYPANYAFDLRIRGSGPRNDLQFKLVDAGGDNVWWVRKPLFALPDAWTPLQFRKRHVSKAWGPSPDTELAHSAMLEFTLASGEGGKGEACFDALSFRDLPPSRLKLVALMGERLRFPAGSEIVRDADRAEGVYVILEGDIEFAQKDEDGNGRSFQKEAGSIIGDVSLLSGKQFLGKVSAGTEVLALRIPKDLFFELLQTVPEFSLAVSRDLADRVARLANALLAGEAA